MLRRHTDSGMRRASAPSFSPESTDGANTVPEHFDEIERAVSRVS